MAKAKQPQLSEQQQAELITPEMLPDAPALVQAATSYCHTGRTTCRNEEHAERILMFYLSTGSLRQTARQFHVSPNTVKAVLTVFELNKKLDAVKQRLSNKLALVAELGTDLLIERIQDGSAPTNVLSIAVGIAVEKRALIDGEVTSRTETRVTEPVRLDDLAAYLRQHGIAAPAIDVTSTVLPAETQQKP